MKRVFSSPNPVVASQVKNQLEMEGLECDLRQEVVGGGVSGIVPSEAWVEVWVRTADFAKAEDVVRAALREWSPGGSSWKCPACGEDLEAQFTSCWSCGTDQP